MRIIKAIFFFTGVTIALDVACASIIREGDTVNTSTSPQRPKMSEIVQVDTFYSIS